MKSFFKKVFLRPIPYIFSDNAGGFLAKISLRNLKKELMGTVTDKFLELLLGGMDIAFNLSKAYRKNIQQFKGRYLFRTADGMVAASALFENGNLKVRKDAVDDWDIRITFKDSKALLSYIFSENQDILDSLLANEVEVDGNLNYIYKFGFMARDLSHRLGVI